MFGILRFCPYLAVSTSAASFALGLGLAPFRGRWRKLRVSQRERLGIILSAPSQFLSIEAYRLWPPDYQRRLGTDTNSTSQLRDDITANSYHKRIMVHDQHEEREAGMRDETHRISYHVFDREVPYVGSACKRLARWTVRRTVSRQIHFWKPL